MNLQDPSLSEIVTSGNESAVREILSSGADANQTNSRGQPPLILAIVAGHTHLLPLLLEAGADPYLKDSTGLNAIEWAERKGRQDLASKLTNQSSPMPGVAPLAPETAAVGTPANSNGAQRTRADSPQVTADTLANKQHSDNSQPDGGMADSPGVSTTPATASPVKKSTRASSSRKRCPQCNAYYNSELLAYCAYDSVALVDADLPIVVPPSPDRMTPLLWLLVLLVLGGAIGLAYVIIRPLYTENQKPVPPAASVSAPVISKGIPIAGGNLKGKALAMPEAEIASMSEGQTVVVTVKVKVDKRGYVTSAVSSGGEDPFRQAATDAAQKAIFSVELLRARGTEGTITYTFTK